MYYSITRLVNALMLRNILIICALLLSGVPLIKETTPIVVEYRGNYMNEKFLALKRSLNLYNIYSSGLVSALIDLYKVPECICVFGSFAKGEDIKESDIDLWIKTRHETAEINRGRAIRAAKDSLNAETSILFLNPESMENIRKKESALYCGLLDSITLWGENID